MARHWSPRRVVECPSCQWWGLRTASTTRKACPECKSARAHREGLPSPVMDGDLTEPQRRRLESANKSP